MQVARLILAAMLALAAAGANAQTDPAHAQTYPAKTIRIVVPNPPGGTSDILARSIGQKLNEAWGQPVIVENRAGANGNIGANLVAKSPADVLFNGMLPVYPHVKGGRMRALAVTSPKRVAAAPEIPTVAESGLPGFETGSWQGMLAPAGTSREIVLKLNAEIRRILGAPEIKAQLANQGTEIRADAAPAGRRGPRIVTSLYKDYI